MARTRRILTRSGDQFDTTGEEWQTNTNLDLSTDRFAVVDLPFALGFSSQPVTRIVIWEDGFISFGNVTQAQIDWVAANPPPAGRHGFPGDYIEAGRVDVRSDIDNITYAAGSIDFEADPSADPPYSRDDAVDIFRITWTTPDFNFFQIQFTRDDFAIVDPTVGSAFEPVVPFGFRIGGYSFDPFEQPVPDYFLDASLGGFYEGNAFANVIGGTVRDDTILGRSGDDQLYGNNGADLIQGMRGNDLLVGGGDKDFLHGDSGNDEAHGGRGWDELDGGLGSDLLHGDDGNDRLIGDIGHDRLHGGGGNDEIFGEANQDAIFGGGGDDFIQGGAQTDTMTGGTGADMFRFVGGDSSAIRWQADIITDFSRAQGDLINLRQIDARDSLGGDQKFTFIGNDAFSGREGELRYQTVNDSVFVLGDTNGDQSADFYIRIDGLPTPAAADFLL